MPGTPYRNFPARSRQEFHSQSDGYIVSTAWALKTVNVLQNSSVLKQSTKTMDTMEQMSSMASVECSNINSQAGYFNK